ncbi:MAG TPA: LysR family transcriptional regulator [Pseudomonadota bacterium]|nr:LysR family transcriptional regulator [Pseudomonadota bacterium]
MELSHLRYFLAITQAGSISAAAKRLRISQPALTVAIHQLEKELSCTLFHRDHSGVTLTGVGAELGRHAEQIFSLLEHAQQEVRALQHGALGRFVLGCHESLGAYFLPGFMSGFWRSEPRIELSLWNAPSAAVEDAVVERKVHFGLVVNPRRLPDLVIIDLFHDAVDLFIATPPDGSLPSLAEAIARVVEGPIIYAGRVMQCTELIERLAGMQVASHRLLSCGDLELVKSLALSGIGVALLPRRVAAYGQRGRLTRLHPELPNFPDTISLVYRADLPRTVATGRLKDALVAHGRALDRLGDAHDPHEHPPATTLTPLPAERIDPRPLGTTSSRTPTARRPRSKK